MRHIRILFVVMLMSGAGWTGTANAQTVTNLYSFSGTSDGENPEGELVQGSDGNFYGTTFKGGAINKGRIFQISPSGTYSNLHSFGNSSDGSFPGAGLVEGGDGYFYGTAYDGGENSLGTVFRISPTGNYTNLHSFLGSPTEGANPQSRLAWGSDGFFYGTTVNGGATSNGTVFRISPAGSFSNLYSFASAPDGQAPFAGLVQGSDGYFYGTTRFGGTNDNGAVFRISSTGSYSNLHTFAGVPDGERPTAALVQGVDGNFYGTTSEGGTIDAGTVFRISPTGSYSNLYSFAGFPNGEGPNTKLVLGSDGLFYGATSYGGTNSNGLLFRISPTGSQTNLYSFGDSPDGSYPYGGLVQGIDGNFFGTTDSGGANFMGTVFKLTVPLGPAPNEISSSQLAVPGVDVSFPSIAGESYQLQSRPSLNAGIWSNVPGVAVINSIGGTQTLTGVAAQAQTFYRLGIRIGGIPVPAWDNAAEKAYGGGWTNGSNGGYGFGPWVLQASSPSVNSNGFFIGYSTSNAFATSPGIDVSGKSWGIYASELNIAAAYRSFAGGPLAVGQSLHLNMDNGYIDNGWSVGFALRTGNEAGSATNFNTGARFEFLYIGGDPSNSYKVVDNGGTQNLGPGFTGTGKRLVFTLTAANSYTLQTIDNADGTTNTIGGDLGGAFNSTIDSIAIYNHNAGSGPDHDTFFNSLQITGP